MPRADNGPSLSDVLSLPSDEFKRLWLGMPLGRFARMAAALAEAEPPAWLGLTPAQVDDAKAFANRVADEYPATSIDELLWCLLVEATRLRTRGRKRKWLGIDGLMLVSAVHVELRARGAATRDRKAVRQAIGRIRAQEPERYRAFSEERLRDAYYQARRRTERRHAEFFVGGV